MTIENIEEITCPWKQNMVFITYDFKIQSLVMGNFTR